MRCCGVGKGDEWKSGGGRRGFLPLTIWTIWLERNRRTFRDVAVSVFRLKSWFLSVLLSWVSGRVDPDLNSFLEALDALSI